MNNSASNLERRATVKREKAQESTKKLAMRTFSSDLPMERVILLSFMSFFYILLTRSISLEGNKIFKKKNSIAESVALGKAIKS